MLGELKTMESGYESLLLQEKTVAVESRIRSYEELIRFVSKLPAVAEILGKGTSRAGSIKKEKAVARYAGALSRAFDKFPDIVKVQIFDTSGMQRFQARHIKNQGLRIISSSTNTQTAKPFLKNAAGISAGKTAIVTELRRNESDVLNEPAQLLLHMITPISLNNSSIGIYVGTVDVGILSKSFPGLHWVLSDGKYLEPAKNSRDALKDFPGLSEVLSNGRPGLTGANPRIAWQPLYKNGMGNFVLWAGQDIQLASAQAANERVYYGVLGAGSLVVVFGLLIAALVTQRVRHFFINMRMLLESAVLRPEEPASSPKAKFSEVDDFLREVTKLTETHAKLENERHAAVLALQKNEDLLRTMTNAVQCGVMLVDDNYYLRLVNPAAESLFGYASDELLGRSIDEVFVPSRYKDTVRDKIKTHLHDINFQNTYSPVEIVANCKDGSELPVELSFGTVSQEGNDSVVIVATDISERKKREAVLVKFAETDPLTGANNRRSFDILARQAIIQHRKTNIPLYLAMFDLDHFKVINDEHGHAVGDLAIQLFAQICIEKLRDTDIFARIGGEEFVALITANEQSELLAIAERIRLSVENTPVLTNDQRVPAVQITVSIGATKINLNYQSLKVALETADNALYEAKSRGRNCVVLQ